MKTGIATLVLSVLSLAGSAFASEDALAPVVKRLLENRGLPVNHQIPDTRPAAEPRLQAQAVMPPSLAPDSEVSGLIVRFRDNDARARARANRPPPAALIALLTGQAGPSLRFERAMSMEAFVFRFDSPHQWRDVDALIQKLRKLPGIDHIEPDFPVNSTLLPNDPYLYNQWALAPTDVYPGAINAVGAWDIDTGSSATVVAVLDTGITTVASRAIGSHRILPGYDFISDIFTANDGNGRDANPADPGDWVDAGECEEPESPSSWHGTHIAGIIAAAGNDGSNIAGIDWQTRILPIRVLGKCGGYAADVIDGMRWAAGLPIPGVPDNPNPARILNMSLGGPSPFGCSYFLQQVVNDVRRQNSLIVVAAGNDDIEAATVVPASCDGVMTVGATDHLGLRSSYSNYSFQNRVHISAPGGDFSYYDDPQAGILSIVDRGTRSPTSATRLVYAEGTSAAAPQVSGVGSLALAIDPNQHTQLIGTIMRVSSRPFPAGSECAESYPLCGDGLLDARNTLDAVAALKPYHLVWGFYNPDLNHYFRAGGYDEVELVLSGIFGNWIDTEDYFIGWRDDSEGAVPVCRFYGTPGIGPNSHFYTGDPEECAKVKTDPGWTYEGTAFYIKLPHNGVCPADTISVYRYYNKRWQFNDSNHRYVTQLHDQDEMIAEGWVLEGIAMCAAG